ncbi:hypothetical protein JGH11_04765 [Dysgonomonas sp. Marseille-P4677]|uniref:hypothetical protein n=1 Tax=Dysgonomonas sp. Marseille-P4677 TaxID=2364790 RepID=UPI0019133FBA|nr:hypothetical protein [Dysgonomonas sp. Marseille-P4677]MBK5720178.1 hypothetical protein [Dysgonomonas sp. Marseille-P4677]
MQALRILFLFTMCISFFNCSDDDFKFSTESLIQTKWKGDLKEYHKGENIRNSTVGIIFYNEQEGEYDVKAENASNPTNTEFSYSIEEKVLIIMPSGITLGGRWIISHSEKNKMTLERGTGSDDGYNGIMTLTKVN